MQIPASLRSDFIHIASERSIHIVGIRTLPIVQPSLRPSGRKTDVNKYSPDVSRTPAESSRCNTNLAPLAEQRKGESSSLVSAKCHSPGVIVSPSTGRGAPKKGYTLGYRGRSRYAVVILDFVSNHVEFVRALVSTWFPSGHTKNLG